jgi:hypothetical protein
MSNVLLYKDRYKEEFAECMVEKYKLSQYGIQCAKSAIDCDLAYLRNEILEWAENEDAGALTQVSVAYMSWLPVTFNGNPAAYIGGFSTAGQTCNGGPVVPCCDIGMSYPTENGNVNIIDVNVGGCMTRINVNPNITINGGSYQYYIPTAAATWTINHNLGFVPNVLTTDVGGNEISGVVTTATISIIVVEFSEAVSGYAYLS